MSFVSHLRCLACGAEYPPDTIMNLCPKDQRPVEMILDVEKVRAEKQGSSWHHPERKNMWRFGALMPLDMDNPDEAGNIISLGEGCTPLLDYSDHPLAEKFELRLEIKEEGKAVEGFGANPTQSFKDRGMSVAVSMAKKLGLNKLAVPTQGNAGDALAEYALAAGLEAVIVMPDDTPMPILGKIAAYEKLHPNIHMDVVKGTIREAGMLIKQKYIPQGYFSVATFQEPGWRIEGKKTMGLEIAEPRHAGDAWKLPDVIIYPTGGGTGILGMWKAFGELESLGLIGPKRPRIVCVQSESTPTVVNAFNAHLGDALAIEAGKTIAAGLNVPGGVGHFQVLKILYASNGCAVAVSENSIAAALREIYRTKGWWISPEGAACMAALDELIRKKAIGKQDHVVVFNTGSFEKYLPTLRHLL